MQLVVQRVDTQEDGPCLVFWDTGSQVTPTMHRVAQGMRLQAIPGSPLNLVGIGDDHHSRETVRYKVPLIDIGGRVVLVTNYGIERIMGPLEEGNLAPMRATFPEVPAGRLTAAAREVSLLVGQDNLGLFPSEWKRIGNAALFRSWFGTVWIASGRLPRAKGGGGDRHVGVCTAVQTEQ